MSTYLFDFDGTLVDSMPTYVSAMLKILDEHRIPYGDDIVKIITPLGMHGTADYFIRLGVQKSREELVAAMQAHVIPGYRNTIPAKKNVIAVLRELKNRGDRLNVLTASPHITLDACLKRLGIFDLFENVWSCEDFSTTKADPEIYKLAADRLGVAVEEVIFIDDNYNADLTAKKAGMVVYGIYDEYSKEYVEDLKAVTDRYLYDFAELLV